MSVTTSETPTSGRRIVLPAGGIDLRPGRRRVTQQDLTLYQALVGVPQTVQIPLDPEPAAQPVTDPLDPDDGDHPAPASTRWKWARPLGGGLVDPMLRSIPPSGGGRGGHRDHPVPQPWSPATLCMNLADYCDDLSVRIRKPHIAAWAKRLSKQARQQIVRAQSRLVMPWRG